MASDAVADVRDRTDIVNLVSDYVQLRKAGRNFKGLCPFHQEKTPSFIVFPDSGNFKCFGCGKGGDVFTFYKEVERVDFREALEELARRAGVELKSAPKPSPEREAHRLKLTELNELAATGTGRLVDRARTTTRSFSSPISQPIRVNPIVPNYSVGQRVFHAQFGEGTVSDVVARNNDQEVAVEFARHGKKRLLASIAPLDLVD
jgi:hypothetical protein